MVYVFWSYPDASVVFVVHYVSCKDGLSPTPPPGWGHAAAVCAGPVRPPVVPGLCDTRGLHLPYPGHPPHLAAACEPGIRRLISAV